MYTITENQSAEKNQEKFLEAKRNMTVKELAGATGSVEQIKFIQSAEGVFAVIKPTKIDWSQDCEI